MDGSSLPSAPFPSPREAEAIVHAVDRCVREVPVSALRTSRRGTVRVVNRRALLAGVLEVLDAFLAHRVQGVERELAGKVLAREEQAREEGQMRVLASLADLCDTIEAVAAGLPDPRAGRALAKRLERLFGTYGFERIAAVGTAFDPRLHEAVDSEPAAGHRRGEITREVSAGFRRGDFVLRVARVIVAE
jgi:molecular chaperone GrpE